RTRRGRCGNDQAAGGLRGACEDRAGSGGRAVGEARGAVERADGAAAARLGSTTASAAPASVGAVSWTVAATAAGGSSRHAQHGGVAGSRLAGRLALQHGSALVTRATDAGCRGARAFPMNAQCDCSIGSNSASASVNIDAKDRFIATPSGNAGTSEGWARASP